MTSSGKRTQPLRMISVWAKSLGKAALEKCASARSCHLRLSKCAAKPDRWHDTDLRKADHEISNVQVCDQNHIQGQILEKGRQEVHENREFPDGESLWTSQRCQS